MATLEQQFEWLKEVLEEIPRSFADYYREDIANYLDVENIKAENLKDLLGSKFDNFTECKNKKDVLDFVHGITGYIVMKAQIEELVADYLS